MEDDFNYIEPIQEELENALHKKCCLFIAIGMGKTESPRWFNFGGFDYQTRELTIQSTQVGLGFTVKTDFVDVDVNEFWGQFKAFRTKFLEKYYPTIDRY